MLLMILILSLISICQSAYQFVAKSTFTVDGSGGSEIGISGYMRTANGILAVNLDFSNVNWSNPDIPANCNDGLTYHVHQKWTHDFTYYNTGNVTGKKQGWLSDCNSTYTGGHWDSWIACGGATGNTLCDNKGGCINPSTVFGDSDSVYDCNGDYDEYLEVPYRCEVGDWSGKYGKIYPNESGIYETLVQSKWEIPLTVLAPNGVEPVYSVVIHCNGGSRMWCALMERESDKIDEIISLMSDSIVLNFTTPVSQNESILEITEEGMTVTLDTDLAGECSNYYITLYGKQFNGYPTDWTSNVMINCDTSILGNIYDPTYTCVPSSSQSQCDGSTTTLCGTSRADYLCDSSNDYYSCAVGDISTRVGVQIALSGSNVIVDPLAPSLSSYTGRVLVFACPGGSISNICILPDPYIVNVTTTAAPAPTSNSNIHPVSICIINFICLIVCFM